MSDDDDRSFEDYRHDEDTRVIDALRQIASSYYLDQYQRDFIRNVLHPRGRHARARVYNYELNYLSPKQRIFLVKILRNAGYSA